VEKVVGGSSPNITTRPPRTSHDRLCFAALPCCPLLPLYLVTGQRGRPREQWREKSRGAEDWAAPVPCSCSPA
jgi:hypothetical protein